MELAGKSYPMRAVVRHKAKQQLQSEFECDRKPLDRTLLLELAATLFKADKNQGFERGCRSRQEAIDIENKMAAELVEAYKQIKKNQEDKLVQNLNSLLSKLTWMV